MNNLRIGLVATLLLALPAQADNRDLELSFLTPVVADNLIDYAHLDVAMMKSIAVGIDENSDYLELIMHPGQPLSNGGNRAEISVDFPFEWGDTLTYSWRMRIPENAKTDPQNRWWYLAQWVDQPDPRNGETWDSFPYRVPPVSLGYATIDGQEMIGFSYGVSELRLINHVPIARDIWVNIRVIIHWSPEWDGWAKVYIDDTLLGQADGANMYNSYRHFFKMGTDRDHGIKVFSRVQLDDLQIEIINN